MDRPVTRSPALDGPTDCDRGVAAGGWPRRRRSRAPPFRPRRACARASSSDWPECSSRWRYDLARYRPPVAMAFNIILHVAANGGGAVLFKVLLGFVHGILLQLVGDVLVDRGFGLTDGREIIAIHGRLRQRRHQPARRARRRHLRRQSGKPPRDLPLQRRPGPRGPRRCARHRGSPGPRV